jgi:hypothetical protein
MRGALPFAIASLFTVLWAVCSVLEYAAINLEVKTTWVKFQVFELTYTSHHLRRFLPNAWSSKV